jgi:PKD repeat protein
MFCIMRTKFFLQLISLSLPFFSLQAQNESSKWYFGNQAGLDFSTNPPTALTNGTMNTGEGCASIADASGNLLFYTNGITVYDQTHTVMANGSSLAGGISSAQAALIVKKPGSPSLYYIFTTNDAQTTLNGSPIGLAYSIVDMSLAAGMGSVTVKNATLYAPTCEKLAGTRHCNGTDTWIVSHEYNSNVFRSYLLTSAGISPAPVLSATGLIVSQPSSLECQLKISPNGRKLAMAMGLQGFGLYDFDRSTGMVSNEILLTPANSNLPSNVYGCEFSPNSQLFYGQSIAIHQWNLASGTASAIIASQYSVASGYNFHRSMQLAPDGKIYIAAVNQQSLSVIHNPDIPGAGCGYQYAGLSLGSKISNAGLPNLINGDLVSTTEPFTYTITCQNVAFSTPICGGITSVLWDFGDPSSGASNSSTLTSPSHSYSALGIYTVKCIYYRASTSDTVSIPITIFSLPPSLSVSGTFTMCQGEKRFFTAMGAFNYIWQTSANSQAPGPSIQLSPSATMQFTLYGSSNGCSNSKIFTVQVEKCTGEAELLSSQQLRIFPVPFDDRIILEVPTEAEVRILNPAGQLQWHDVIAPGSNTINTSLLPQGIYFIQLSGKNFVKNLSIVKTSAN